MCGILVVPNQDIKEELELSFKALYRRGPDMERGITLIITHLCSTVYPLWGLNNLVCNLLLSLMMCW